MNEDQRKLLIQWGGLVIVGILGFVFMNFLLLLVTAIYLFFLLMKSDKPRFTWQGAVAFLLLGIGVIVFMFLVFDLSAFIGLRDIHTLSYAPEGQEPLKFIINFRKHPVIPTGKIWSKQEMQQLLKNLSFIFTPEVHWYNGNPVWHY